MNQVILGKRLISDTEIIWYCRGPENVRQRSLAELQKIATDAALLSSLIVIRLCKQDKHPYPFKNLNRH